MTIQHTITDTDLVIRPEGRLDTNTAPEFEAAAKELLPGMKTIEIDLAGVDYVSSAGLRALLTLHKACTAAGAALAVENVSPAVMDVFTMTGFNKVLTIR